MLETNIKILIQRKQAIQALLKFCICLHVYILFLTICERDLTSYDKTLKTSLRYNKAVYKIYDLTKTSIYRS